MKALRIIGGVVAALALCALAGVVAKAITGSTDKGIETALIALPVVPLLFYVVVLALGAWSAARATARGARVAGAQTAKAAARGVYALTGADVGSWWQRVRDRWREKR